MLSFSAVSYHGNIPVRGCLGVREHLLPNKVEDTFKFDWVSQKKKKA